MSSNDAKRVVVLISGRGSNLSTLLAACADPGFPARICGVVANAPGAGGLAIAQKAGIATKVVDHRTFASREAFEVALQAALMEMQPQIVILAGFMRILSDSFVHPWRGRLINIHPSLLPLFKGLRTHAQALAARARVHGCTVHFVEPAMDAGPIIAQATVPVLDGDTPETLGARVLVAEHALYPKALAMVASGDIVYDNGKAVVRRLG